MSISSFFFCLKFPILLTLSQTVFWFTNSPFFNGIFQYTCFQKRGGECKRWHMFLFKQHIFLIPLASLLSLLQRSMWSQQCPLSVERMMRCLCSRTLLSPPYLANAQALPKANQGGGQKGARWPNPLILQSWWIFCAWLDLSWCFLIRHIFNFQNGLEVSVPFLWFC